MFKIETINSFRLFLIIHYCKRNPIVISNIYRTDKEKLMSGCPA